MAGNKRLHTAKQEQNDEFYTQLTDIEKELRHYRDHFRGKIVFCNCDDPFESNFFKYFAMNFNRLRLKKLIATCYVGSPVVGEQLSLGDLECFKKTFIIDEKQPYKIEITQVRDENGDGAINLADVEHLLKNSYNTLTLLKGDGDFRSPECISLLKEADIVVTNPPFSLFREYVAQLIEYDKDFLIIGGQNAITYKEIFSLFKDNKIWLGIDNGGTKWFKVPDHYNISTESRIRIVDGEKYFSMGSIMWFTNLDHLKRHENIILYKKYDAVEYPKYDTYNAINVNKNAEIPIDYTGIMGVPITFLDKYNPEQFEVIGIDRYVEDNPNYGHRFKINGKEIYARILIRHRGTINEN